MGTARGSDEGCTDSEGDSDGAFEDSTRNEGTYCRLVGQGECLRGEYFFFFLLLSFEQNIPLPPLG